MKFLRFLNLLDPDHDQLSPVRIQAWIATAQATGCLIGHANDWYTGSSIVWATFAHVIHIADKSGRARNLALLGAQDARAA